VKNRRRHFREGRGSRRRIQFTLRLRALEAPLECGIEGIQSVRALRASFMKHS
jgi:hypothetical protein